MFKRKAKISIGLEISNSYLRVIELRDNDGVRSLRSSNELELDEGVIVAGVIRDKKALARQLKNLFQTAKPYPIKQKEIHFAIPDELVYIGLLRSENKSAKGLKQMIEEEYQRNIPIKKEESEYSYKVLDKNRGEDEDGIEILLVAALKKSLLAWQNFFEENGYKLDFFDIDMLAAFRAIDNEDEYPCSSLVIKEDYSRFAIFSDKGLEYEYSLDFGRKKVAECMASNSHAPDSAINEHSCLVGLVEDIKENIRYFEENANITGKSKLNKLLISGKTEEAHHLQEYFAKHSDIEKIEMAKNKIDINFDDTKYNQAIGLALRSWTHKYEKTDPFLPCIGHAYSLETNIRNKEENIIQFLYKIKNTVLLPLAVLLIVSFGWLSFGLIQGSHKAEPDSNMDLPAKSPAEEVGELLERNKDAKKEEFIVVDDIGIPLNVRKGPATTYEIIGQVDPGSEQVLVKEDDGWYNIEWPNEQSAWVSGDYASKVE